MPRYSFTRWTEEKSVVYFTADSLEDAKKQMEDALHNTDELQDVETYFLKGNEDWLQATLSEIEDDEEADKAHCDRPKCRTCYPDALTMEDEE